MRKALWLLFVLTPGCLPVYDAQESSTSTTSADGTSTSTSAGKTTSSTTGAASATMTVDDTGMPRPDLSSTPDLGLGSGCDIFAQDCPMGQKCAWTAPPEASWFEETTCVPLAPDPLPPGAPCQYDLEQPLTGIDECPTATACVEGFHGPGPWDGEGTCKPLCKGTGEHPYCDAGEVCVGGRALWLCTPMCDPLAQDCVVGLRCDIYGGGATLCVGDWPEEPRRAIGEPCEWQEQCELGATCLAGAVPDCAGERCCAPFCDRTDPQATCPLPGQKCLAPWDLVHEVAGAEAVGACRLEVSP